jgi:hypothetical protein
MMAIGSMAILGGGAAYLRYESMRRKVMRYR